MQQIRHRRLEAFFKSKVLNSLMVLLIVSLQLMGYTRSMLLPVMCAAVAFGLFVAYSLWLWIKKPKRIVIDSRLSDVSGLFTLYFMVILSIKEPSGIWYIIPALAAIGLFFISMISPRDELFDIERPQ